LLGGRRVVEWSVRAAAAVSEGIVVVVASDHRQEAEAAARSWVQGTQPLAVVVGGATRAESVRRGLEAVPNDVPVIVVHDGARPLASVELFASVVSAVSDGAAAAVPGVPLTDTVKEVAGGLVSSTPDRERLIAVQTPQAFDASVLRRAHAGEPDATDDAGLVERLGLPVAVVNGEPENLKITRRVDLVVAEALLAGNLAASIAGASGS
jgi:2-C-methyl-D-erythritol 4-phosphate cytidylyltransferase